MGIPTSWIIYPTSTTMRSNYGSSSDDLRIVVVFGSSSGHFMTHSTREGQLRFPFRAMPTGLLWSANFWVDIEKQNLEKKNALQTYECRTKIKQKTQVMMKDLADETVLESREMSTTKRIYQEESSIDQRLKTSEYTVQPSASSISPGIEAETDVFNSENDENSETNDLDTPNHEKAIDYQEEVKEESNNKVEKENKKGPFRMREQNRMEVAESYRAMDKRYMWKLLSGRIVEEELFKLGNDLEFEHAIHSLILDTEDELIMEHFTKEELEKIEGTAIPEVPDLSDEIDNFLGKFIAKNLNEIRQMIKESMFGNDYNREKHHDVDYIRLALYSL
ncbi:5569_t:CDS:2, partial [Cetraspora pellucida]